jgi:hypothetical protein
MRRLILVFVAALACVPGGEAAAPPPAAKTELALKDILQVGGKELPVLLQYSPKPQKMIGFQFKVPASK